MNRSLQPSTNELERYCDNTLIERSKCLVAKERQLLKEILLTLQEIEKRRLYLLRGHSSLFVFCTRELGYSEAAAQRRIDAMRAIKDLPEIAEKIELGRLTLSSVALAQKTFRQQKKACSISVEINKKREVINSIENKSRSESEKILATEFPKTLEAQRPDITRALTPSQSEIRFVADAKLLEKLQSLRHKYSHNNPNLSYNELFHIMADRLLKTSPKENKLRTAPPLRSGAGTSSSPRHIPSRVRRLVFERDNGCCQYIDRTSRTRCLSRHLIQVDHILPVALGGQPTLENLQLLCAAHNRLKGGRLVERH